MDCFWGHSPFINFCPSRWLMLFLPLHLWLNHIIYRRISDTIELWLQVLSVHWWLLIHASSTWTSSLNFNHACIWTSIEHLELDILIPQPNSPYLFHLSNSNTILLASQAKLSKSPLTPLLFSLPTFYSPTNPTGITFKIYLDLLISLISSPTSSSKPALCTT